MKGVKTGLVTFMGLIGPHTYPLTRGNSFGVFTDEQANKDRMVVNMYHENFEELVRTGVVSYPVEIVPVGSDRAVIVDQRIPKEWFHT